MGVSDWKAANIERAIELRDSRAQSNIAVEDFGCALVALEIGWKVNDLPQPKQTPSVGMTTDSLMRAVCRRLLSL